MFLSDGRYDNKKDGGMKEAVTIVVMPRLAGLGAVARRCGCTPVHLRYVMKGERNPSRRLARKLAALGVKARLDGSPIRAEGDPPHQPCNEA